VLTMGGFDMDYHEPIFTYRPTMIARKNLIYVICNKIIESVSPNIILLDGMIEDIDIEVGNVDKIPCPWCNLTKYDSDGILENLIGRRAINEIDRRRRRIMQEGDVVLHHYNKDNVTDCEGSLRRMLECHSERWPGAFKAPGLHADLVRYGVEAGIVDFSELRVGGKPVSWYIAFVWRDTYYLYMPAWETDYRNRGVGKMHLAMLVTEAARRGVKRLDFMRGEEAYKLEWCDSRDYVFDYRIEGRTFRSRLINALLRLRR
ncbi:MAG: GNAT family N-acetyltransferase, partial [Muribaculaceae bacterium]|nr:GNAT family N-acetyltransferase [Muribaculaceae bacterium]